jgi:uncharacterized protein GlcG (DUF336 family)
MCGRYFPAAGVYLIIAGFLLTSARAQVYTSTDLARIFGQASDRAREISPRSVIAIVDRDGRALLVLRADRSSNVTAAERAIAVSKAGTAVMLSSNVHAFSSRTAGFIIQQNFPPGVLNRPPGPLVGVGFSNLAFSDVNYLRERDGRRIPGTRLYGSPGGVPLFKQGILFAGIGVTGDGTEEEDSSNREADTDEAVAMSGQIGYEPAEELYGSHVFLDGIRVPYVSSQAQAAGTASALASGADFDVAPPVLWPGAVLGGAPGQIRAPIRGDPVAGSIEGQSRLTEAEVRRILANAAARTLVTRGGIRLPPGQAAQVFISVVNNPARAGEAPVVLGTFRTADATIFSWDVSVQKARTALFFSNNTRAYSSRTVGFLAQSNFPPGLQNQPPGPFNGLQERFSVPVLTGTGAINPNLPNGITIFPGGFPLYRNGVLIGAIGVSGDGIDQDDLMAASGTAGFQPAPENRADAFSYLGARLPYAKFPRDAELRPGVAPAVAPGPGVLPAVAPAGFEAVAGSRSAAGEILNLSARGWVAAGTPLIVGFVLQSEQRPAMLLRGVGPGLAALAVGDALRAPTTSLYASSGAQLSQNDGWNSAANAAEIATATESVGAFKLDANAADNAVLTALPTGAYTLVLGTRDGAAGTALAEVYDAAASRVASNLKNVSIRGRIAGGTRPLMAGLVIAPGTERTLLIRGIGPGLASFGLDSSVSNINLRLINAVGQTIAEGAAWDSGSHAGEITRAASAVGAFPLRAGSADVALLVTVLPGAYTIEVSGPDGTAGDVLAEIYSID